MSESKSVDLTVKISPKSISVEQAAALAKRKPSQIHQAIKEDELNYGEHEDLKGRRVIDDGKWTAYLEKCQRLDDRKIK